MTKKELLHYIYFLKAQIKENDVFYQLCTCVLFLHVTLF